ncbi:Cupredoxin [Chaetomium fimeti]|uniref:Cupredoxin n=1 Tax=Chaetomium fimeti TaxID=1854472 RepID=A0AAE0HBQ2_9PEZI|nr:Cupredoxin [Chaetomium fimeti]
MQFTTLALSALASVASAQKTWSVAVAQNGSLTFSPDKLVAQPGEFVQFQFHAGNHTVTQSTFDQPCQPIGMSSNVTGFHSGFLPAAASAEMGMFPTYTIQINSTGPLWLYCAQGKHCGNGMVMVINEPANNPDRTLDSFKTIAAAAQSVTPPADGGESGAGGQTGGGADAGAGAGAGAGGDSTDTTGGTDPSGTDDAVQSTISPAAAGMLTVPGTFALAVAGVVALVL